MLNSDDGKYSGHDRIDPNCEFFTQDFKHDNRDYSIMVSMEVVF